MNRYQDFLKAMNDRFKTNVILDGDHLNAVMTPRFSTGVLSCDCAFGGGHLFGKIEHIAGGESTGKTTLTLLAAKSIMDYDHNTKLHRDFVPPEEFDPCVTLMVDVEARADLKWAFEAFNVRYGENAFLSRTETSEQAIDLVTEALVQNIYGMIVIDSLAAMSPSKEIEESSEDAQMGVNARLLNKAFRKWQAALARLSQQGKIGPCILVLNQFRQSMQLYSGPELPGGKAQRYAASLRLETLKPEYSAGELRDSSIVTLRGRVKKNSVYAGMNAEYTFDLCTSPHESYGYGEVTSNVKELKKRGLALGLIERDGPSRYVYKGVSAKTQQALIDEVVADPVLRKSLWRDIVYLETGYNPDLRGVFNAKESAPQEG